VDLSCQHIGWTQWVVNGTVKQHISPDSIFMVVNCEVNSIFLQKFMEWRRVFDDRFVSTKDDVLDPELHLRLPMCTRQRARESKRQLCTGSIPPSRPHLLVLAGVSAGGT
jgi:hypothetical protein